MQEVLVDRGELVGEHLVQEADDRLVALHGRPPMGIADLALDPRDANVKP
jgi:hypothetical protein